MADVVKEVVAKVSENLTENATNTTGKTPSTPEGMAVAYGSLVIMALLPIFLGSYRSVKHHKEKLTSSNVNIYSSIFINTHSFGLFFQKSETMTSKDAAMFPVVASCALFGLYIVFQIFSKEYINLLLTGYFFFLGVLALTNLLRYVTNIFMQIRP